MILLHDNAMQKIVEDSESSYPNEACGLLLGKRRGANVHVASVHVSDNVSEKPRSHFEVDPQLRFDLERLARKKNVEVVAVYHSHPNGVAEPSAVDLSNAWETDLIWIIVAVESGKAASQRAYRLETPKLRFVEINIQIKST
jgi:proteasome lid subunit RPN8/RPN11